MALKTIDLSQLNREHEPGMSYAEYQEELKKPRAERRGLPKIPDDMVMHGDGLTRHQQSCLAHHKQSSVASTRAFANGRMSNCY